jgi:tripartite-type tricarboxylate transporter receptor subunit TctC
MQATHRRQVLCTVWAVAAWAGLALPAVAQTFPDKPVRLVVPFAAGGGTDILARDLGPRLAEALGQPVIIDNKGGAGGNIGTDYVARAPADGYTLLFGSNSMTINAGLYDKLSFDPVKSFAPVGLVGTAPLVLVVHPQTGLQNVRELIQAAKDRPGALNWSAPGNGTPHHLATALFNQMTGSDIVHVQYKGGGPAIADLIAHQTQAGIQTLSSVRGYIDTGRLRALGVATAKRSALYPSLRTIAEAGVPGYEVGLWYGIFAPANTPAAVVQTLNHALNKVLANQAVQTRFAERGYELQPGAPADLGKLTADDLARSTRIIRDAKIKAD